MLQSTQLILAVSAGSMASLLYFGGLWVTVNQLADSSNPMGAYIASFVVRTGILACGLFALLQLGWQHVAAACVGFLIVRYVMTLSLGVWKPRLNSVKMGKP